MSRFVVFVCVLFLSEKKIQHEWKTANLLVAKVHLMERTMNISPVFFFIEISISIELCAAYSIALAPAILMTIPMFICYCFRCNGCSKACKLYLYGTLAYQCTQKKNTNIDSNEIATIETKRDNGH